MTEMQKLLALKCLAGALLTCAASAVIASPVMFSVTQASVTPASGYGIDTNENSGTLLDVRFTALAFSVLNPLSFSLDSVNSFSTFQIGSLAFHESNGHRGILNAETDDLGVTASFTFANPLGSILTLTATGVATAGRINGSGDENNVVDYVLAWDELTNIAFGNGGLFDISLSPIAFSSTNDSDKSLNATITLRALPLDTQPEPVPEAVDQPVPATVPEPGSLALLATAMTAAGWATRRRRIDA